MPFVPASKAGLDDIFIILYVSETFSFHTYNYT